MNQDIDSRLNSDKLLGDISKLIENCRAHIAQSLNSALVLLYWEIGNRTNIDILGNNKAEYGEQIIKTLAIQLTSRYGKGFNRTNLFNMSRFASMFPDAGIVQTLSGQLSWSHLIEIIYLEDPLQREFYIEMCRVERWSVRVLREKLKSMFFERTAIAKKPEKIIRQELKGLKEEDRMTPDLAIRDPYLLTYLDLAESYSENELEDAILKSMEKFLLELGSDFAFLSRQKRITVDGRDYYMDLVFFHRKLKCMIVLELKLGHFKAAYKGQMELYLRWLEKYEINEGENPPIGIILCSEKSEEHVELLQLEKSGIRVAKYLTELPPKKIFHEQLKKAISVAREKQDHFMNDVENAA